MLFKKIVDARTDARTHDVLTDGHLLGILVPNKCPSVCPDARTMDNGQWAITKAHLEHFVLR